MPHPSAGSARPLSMGAPPAGGHHHHHHHHPAGRQTLPPAVDGALPPQQHWQSMEDHRSQELEEARARASQMEKTMRWWSDCTANWREKWSKVRAERNKAREELRAVRLRLETSLKETAAVRRDRQEIETENAALSAELDQLRRVLLQRCQCGGPVSALAEMQGALTAEPAVAAAARAHEQAEQKIAGARPKHVHKQTPVEVVLPNAKVATVSAFPSVAPLGLSVRDDLYTSTSTSSDDAAGLSSPSKETAAHRLAGAAPVAPLTGAPRVSEYLRAGGAVVAPLVAIAPIQETPPLRIDESPSKTTTTTTSDAAAADSEPPQAERDERAALQRTVESLRRDASELRARLDDARIARQDTLRQLVELRAEHEQQLTSVQLQLRDETAGRESRDEQVAALRAELERLQAENAAEWQRRERLQTEKLAVERENKQMRAHIADLEERLEQRSRQLSQAAETENEQLQTEVLEKSRELSELRHTAAKMRKLLQEKVTELSHAQRRAEQFEAEVRRLRARVEELRRELGSAEDEVDSGVSSQRRLQRTNEELSHQVDSLTVQLKHLQARARVKTSSMSSIKEKILVEGETDDDSLGEL